MVLGKAYRKIWMTEGSTENIMRYGQDLNVYCSVSPFSFLIKIDRGFAHQMCIPDCDDDVIAAKYVVLTDNIYCTKPTHGDCLSVHYLVLEV
jgi:hypothetical protein